MTSWPAARRPRSGGVAGRADRRGRAGPAGAGLAIAAALAQAGTGVVLASRPAARCARAATRLSAGTGDDPQVRHFLAAGIRGRPPGRARRRRPAAHRPAYSYLTGVILPAGGGWTAR